MKTRVSLILGIAVLVLLTASACTDEPPDPANPEGLRVVAAFYPLFEAASAAGGDRVEVAGLTPPGAEPHDLELDTDQVDLILDADVVLYLGGGFQPALEDALAQRDGPSIDLLGATLGSDASGGEVDPHIWLDPSLFSIATAEIAGALADADPPNAAAYRAGARAYQDELGALDTEFRTGLAGCERDLLVTAHDAFGRLAARYGLRVESIAGISPEAEPNPARLDELARLVEREGVTTIFTETLVSAEVAATLAREVGVRTRVLNPLEGLTEDELAAGEDYVSVMRTNLDELRDALGCG